MTKWITFPGKRWSTASAYLRPALGRPNLKTEVYCTATKILFDGKRAVGVEYVQNGEKKRVRSMNAAKPSQFRTVDQKDYKWCFLNV